MTGCSAFQGTRRSIPRVKSLWRLGRDSDMWYPPICFLLIWWYVVIPQPTNIYIYITDTYAYHTCIHDSYFKDLGLMKKFFVFNVPTGKSITYLRNRWQKGKLMFWLFGFLKQIQEKSGFHDDNDDMSWDTQARWWWITCFDYRHINKVQDGKMGVFSISQIKLCG